MLLLLHTQVVLISLFNPYLLLLLPLCGLMMPILNGRLNGAPSLPIAHMSFLFFDVFRVIQRVVRFINITPTKFLVSKTSSSKLLYIITASTRTPTKVTKSYSYTKLTTLVSLPMMSLLQKKSTQFLVTNYNYLTSQNHLLFT